MYIYTYSPGHIGDIGILSHPKGVKSSMYVHLYVRIYIYIYVYIYI